MTQHTYGHATDGTPINDQMIENLADEAERGYEPGQLRGHRRGPGRPPLGEAKTVESVRLEPSLRDEVAKRAAAEGTTVSELMRRALRHYIDTAARNTALNWKDVGVAPHPEGARKDMAMVDKKNIHTVPTEDGWANRREGAKRASSTHATKAEAQAAGRAAAMKDGVEHLIHKKDGTIGNRNSYGNDPHPPKG
jgi:hypothetical protein